MNYPYLVIQTLTILLFTSMADSEHECEQMNSVTHARDPKTCLWLRNPDIREGDWAWYTYWGLGR